MRILVTGATGYVGRNVLPQLVSAGVDVRALTRDPARAKVPAGVDLVRGDLSRPDSLSEALEGVERMYLFRHRRPRVR